MRDDSNQEYQQWLEDVISVFEPSDITFINSIQANYINMEEQSLLDSVLFTLFNHGGTMDDGIDITNNLIVMFKNLYSNYELDKDDGVDYEPNDFLPF